MSDLRTLPNTLAGRGDIVTPSIDAVARRARRTRVRRAARSTALVVVIALLVPSVANWITNGDESSHVRVVDRTTATTVAPPSTEKVHALGSVASGPLVLRSVEPSFIGTPAPPPAPPACKVGENGGSTDRGVTATRIKVVMTETREFPTRYVTIAAADPVKRLVEQVNLEGGICGRLIDFHLANDVWGPLPWQPDADVLAAIAGPLDPAVDEHIIDGSIDRVAVPLFGTDGLQPEQHRSPWVWPIGPSTASLTRIAMDHAYRSANARTFALVYDERTSVGKQAATAFESYARQLPGAVVRHVQPLDPSDDDYGDEAFGFNAKCGLRSCDVVLLAMFSDVAGRWMNARPASGKVSTAALPVLLHTPDFWSGCPRTLVLSRCRDFRVWARSLPLAKSSTSERIVCPDELDDPHTSGAVVSGCILVEALKQASPTLTRERMREVIDDLASAQGLVGRFDNGRRTIDGSTGKAKAWKPVYSKLGEFEGFVEATTDWMADPTPGRHQDDN